MLLALSSIFACSNVASAIPSLGRHMLGNVVSKYTKSAKVDTLGRLKHTELLGEMENWEDGGKQTADDPHPLRMKDWELEARQCALSSTYIRVYIHVAGLFQQPVQYVK